LVTATSSPPPGGQLQGDVEDHVLLAADGAAPAQLKCAPDEVGVSVTMVGTCSYLVGGKVRDLGVTITRGSLHQADRGPKGSSNTSAMVALSTILLRWPKRQGWW
jgi:hypothetical protein